jgi:hypothetical protein
MASPDESATTRQLRELRRLLARLPSSLPEPGPEATQYPFVGFQPDLEFLERTESELGAVNESLKAAFGWKSRSSGDKIIPIVERGKHICAVADVLERYLAAHPGDAVLMKWVADLSDAARNAIQKGNEMVIERRTNVPLIIINLQMQLRSGRVEEPSQSSQSAKRKSPNAAPEMGEIDGDAMAVSVRVRASSSRS